MPEFTIISVGRLKETYFIAACNEYIKRLSSYWPVKIIEVQKSSLPENPSYMQIQNALNQEGGRILSKIPQSSYVSALCVEGKQMDSPLFSSLISDNMSGGMSRFTFIIGGSNGLSDKVKKHASMRLSFSEMTFPHQLMRVMLLEQLYRAYTISAKTPYHK